MNYQVKTNPLAFILLFMFTIPLNSFSQHSTNDASKLKLWYTQPAKEWVEAIPIGNGSLGGMVFGRVDSERVQLNDDTFWSGKRYDSNNPEALPNLPILRRLIKEGEYQKAMDLANNRAGLLEAQRLQQQKQLDLEHIEQAALEHLKYKKLIILKPSGGKIPEEVLP